jgi:hypothetical protein
VELAGRRIAALAPERGGSCLALVDGHEIWRRNAGGGWALLTRTDWALQSLVSVDGVIYGGSSEDAFLVRIADRGSPTRVRGFDTVEGRKTWFGQGPPLGVRSLTSTAKGTILAGVHVGGIPRSTDGGETWMPTIPIDYDVHEVHAHLTRPIVAAATAVGLCVSMDDGANWKVHAEGPEAPHGLAVVVAEDEILFSMQDGPFAKRSQIWRLRIGSEKPEQVREGLPLWLTGKVDTAQLAAGRGEAALVDGGGNLWWSKEGSMRWQPIAHDLGYASGLAVL